MESELCVSDSIWANCLFSIFSFTCANNCYSFAQMETDYCVFQKNIRAGLMLKVKSVLKLKPRFFASSEYLGIGKKANSESNYSQTPLNMDTHIKWTVLFALMLKLYV